MRQVLLLGFGNGELPDDALSQVRATTPEHEIVVTNDTKEMERHLDQLEIAVGSVPFDLLERAPSLRWFHHWHAGVDWLVRHPALTEGSLLVTNASGVHAVSITEHLLGMMTAFARNLHLSIRAQAQGIWRRDDLPPVFELYGKRVLVVGMGAIGTHFSQAISCLGMHPIGIRRTTGASIPGVSEIYGIDRLSDQLPLADFVINTLPATQATYHMFSRRELSLMKKGAYLINIGRGSTIDEAALIEALEHGTLGGAGLDVFETEPLSADSPLWRMPQVIITPHTAGMTPLYFTRGWRIFIDNLSRYLAGAELHNLVDKRAGY